MKAIGTIGVRGAVVERARRQGYARAVSDVITALTGRAPKGIVGRLIDWRSKVNKWHRRIYAASDEATRCEPAPALKCGRGQN